MKKIAHKGNYIQKDYTQRRLYMKGTVKHMLKTQSTEKGLYSREVKNQGDYKITGRKLHIKATLQ